MPVHIRNLLLLTVFAIAMAQVEASVVVHLRTIYYPENPLEIFPLALVSHCDLAIELIRELATVVMILAVALLAGRGRVLVFAGFVFVFGLWDIFYYVWLKLMIGWPQGWWEWDVLFLIPWPWLGPWMAPVLIALLFVVWGGWVICSATPIIVRRINILLFIAGAILVLAAFLLPAVPLLTQGIEAFRQLHPHNFMWWLYVPGYLLMLSGMWLMVRHTNSSDSRFSSD